MKKLSHLILIIALCISFNACTHNNGDIGNLFGTWKLQSITINGEIDSTYQNNVLWKFQATVMSMIRANDVTHERQEGWGSWEYANDETQLVVNFTHTDDYNPKTGSSKYSPLPETYIPKASISTLDIIELNNSKLTLKYISEDGKEYIYKFKRWA